MFYWCSTCFTCFTALPMGTSKNCSVNGSNEPSDNFPARLRGQSKWNEQMLISKTWPVLTAQVSCPSLYAPYHSSSNIHAYIYIYKFTIPCSKTFKAYPCTHHPQVWLGRQRTSSYIYDTHVKQCSTWALGFFVNGFTSGRQMHSRMDETWLSGYESWGSRDLYVGHASIILTQNEEVLTARVTLSGSNWKENPLHLIDASRSAELIFQVDVLWSCLLNFSDWFSSSIIVYHSLS